MKLNFQQVRDELFASYPAFRAEYGDSLAQTNRFYFMERFAEYVVESALESNDRKLANQMHSKIQDLRTRADADVLNAINVSFLEGLINLGYKYSLVRIFIEDLPDELNEFLKFVFGDDIFDRIATGTLDNNLP